MPKPDLKEIYNSICLRSPVARRLLEPKRYAVQGSASELYPNGMQSLVADVTCLSLSLIELGEMPPGVEHQPFNGDLQVLLSHVASQTLRIETGCPTYYLGQDIAQPLLDTEPPADIPLDEIKFPYPAVRVVMPRGALRYKGRGVEFLDIALIESGRKIPFNRELATEAAINIPDCAAGIRDWDFAYEDSAILLVCSHLESADVYSEYMSVSLPWTSNSLGDLLQVYRGHSGAVQDEDKSFGDRALCLAVNIMMVLGAVPEEVHEGEILRKAEANRQGQVIRPELWAPRFIGRPVFRFSRHDRQTAASGARHYDEVRRGHWKRQPHGPDKSQRKIIWVSLYRTRGQEERTNG